MTNESDIRDLRNRYFELCKELGEIINEQQDKILSSKTSQRPKT